MCLAKVAGSPGEHSHSRRATAGKKQYKLPISVQTLNKLAVWLQRKVLFVASVRLAKEARGELVRCVPGCADGLQGT
jgi:hypothetical protein